MKKRFGIFTLLLAVFLSVMLSGCGQAVDDAINTVVEQKERSAALQALQITNLGTGSSSLYTFCNGTVTNKGSTTYKFVKIKGAFMTKEAKTINTDSTYAVGSEGLAPGETVTFRLSVPKNANIYYCVLSVSDYKS